MVRRHEPSLGLLKHRHDGRPSAGIITLRDPRSPVAEAYRALRTNIQFSSLDTDLRTLLVTSAGPNEGKSTTLANLAVVMAEAGKRVLAVDCDLRRSSLHTLFDLENTRGFTSLFLDEGVDPPPIQDTAVPNLRVLTSGPPPPNPSQVLGSPKMARVLETLRAAADVVLFDAPPVLAATDATLLATQVDGVLLVVDAGATRRDLARRARAQLEKVNARLLGVVLNNVPLDTQVYGYYAQR
ncbi:MAG TPA: CpsD/CapB family tyrosine-protein kinase [Chloroflexota bacterium]